MVDDPANELMAYFGVEDCAPYVFLPRDTPLASHKGGTHKLLPADAHELEAWFYEFVRAPGLRLTNDGSSTVDVFWETPGEAHQEQRVLRIAPGATKSFDTFVGHTLVWREALPEGTVGAGPVLARVVVTDEAVASGGLALSALLAGDGDTELLQLTDAAVGTWRGRLRTNLSRIRQNERQPPTVPAFTDVGFKLMKMPRALHERLVEFWAQNGARAIEEGWHVSGGSLIRRREQ
jgi:hypothetical protein